MTRQEISTLLSSIGKPGQKQQEKLEAVRQLELKNNQGHNIEVTLESYPEY